MRKVGYAEPTEEMIYMYNILAGKPQEGR